MHTVLLRAIVIAATVALGACGETPQVAATKKSDTKPWEGMAAAAGTNVSPGWKAGDEKSWEVQMRQRAQGQNEYSRSAPVASKP